MYKRIVKIVKNINQYLYGSNYFFATGLVVVPIASDITAIVAGQMTSFMTALGIYTVKKTLQISIILVSGLIGALF